MRKQVIAFLSALIITAIVALSIWVVGGNAAFNPNGVAVSDLPASSAAKSTSISTSYQAQIAQLQAQLAQYQAREQQYQAALSSDNQTLFARSGFGAIHIPLLPVLGGHWRDRLLHNVADHNNF